MKPSQQGPSETLRGKLTEPCTFSHSVRNRPRKSGSLRALQLNLWNFRVQPTFWQSFTGIHVSNSQSKAPETQRNTGRIRRARGEKDCNDLSYIPAGVPCCNTRATSIRCIVSSMLLRRRCHTRGKFSCHCPVALRACGPRCSLRESWLGEAGKSMNSRSQSNGPEILEQKLEYRWTSFHQGLKMLQPSF